VARKKLRIPTFRLHKPTGQGVVTLNGKDIYPGNWHLPENGFAESVCR